MLVTEMTGSHPLTLPLLASCFSAYTAAELIKETPLYEALLLRDLGRVGPVLALKKPVLVDHFIEESTD